MWFIHAMGYYLKIARSEVMIYAPTWMNLDNIMLSERNQIQKATYYIIPFI